MTDLQQIESRVFMEHFQEVHYSSLFPIRTTINLLVRFTKLIFKLKCFHP